MSSRHKLRRDAWLAAGKCPMCKDHGDLVPGMCFCAKCRARMAGKPRHTAKDRTDREETRRLAAQKKAAKGSPLLGLEED